MPLTSSKKVRARPGGGPTLRAYSNVSPFFMPTQKPIVAESVGIDYPLLTQHQQLSDRESLG